MQKETIKRIAPYAEVVLSLIGAFVPLLVAILCSQSQAQGAATTCFAVANGNWTDNIWASTSGGAVGSCAAAGGSAVTIQGQTATIPNHVPGTAGAFDRATINTGITVHIPAGVGVDLGETTFNTPGAANSLTINATNSSVYGAVVVDKGGLLRLTGTSNSSDNYAVIAQYAALQVMPGGSIWVKSASGAAAPQFQVNGRLHVGCGDQASYPTPFCSGNAGAWVNPSVASTLNFTAVSSLPAGVVVNDLVELSPTPQQLSVPYPYNINGVTPPPAPPMMPVTSDTGSSPMRTCGTVASCLVPNDTLLCVVAISGSSVSLGWPQGGTASQPYCTGAETALAITALGKGRLWLKKPAFFWGDPTAILWNVSRTATWTSRIEGMDAVRSGSYITGAPISNAAQDGPGRYGDNSLSVGSNTFGASTSGEPCRHLSVDRVTSSGCFVDFTSGAVSAFGHDAGGQVFLTMTGTWTFKGATTLTNVPGSVTIPAGSRTYNELIVANSDVRYMFSTVSGVSFFRFSGLPNTANNRMAWVGNTTSMVNNLIGINGVSLTNTTPLEINGNSFLAGNVAVTYGPINLWTASSYVDISHNYASLYYPLFGCGINNASGFGSTPQTYDHVTDVNNQIFSNYYVATDNYYLCNWTNRFSADNRVTANGASELTSGGFSVAYGTNNANTPSANNIFKYNYVLGAFRDVYMSTGQRWTGNMFAFTRHHVATVTSYDANQANGAGGYISNLKVDNNVLVGIDDIQCFNSGYNQFMHLDGLEFSNNFCSFKAGATQGGFNIGDTDGGSFTAITNLKVFSNVFARGTGFLKFAAGSGSNTYNYEQNQTTYAGWNSAVGTNTFYTGFGVGGAIPNGIPNPEMYRNAYVTRGGTNYNLQTGTRNVTGVAIQNPTYTTATSGCLKYTYTSQSSITMQWSIDASCADGTTGYGAAVQLNWGGAGTTYSISSITAVGLQGMTLTTTASSFTGAPANNTTGGTNPVPLGCPIARWVWATTGARAGTAYALVACPGTYNVATAQLAAVPQDTALGTATIAILQWEIRLYDAGGVDHIDIGIDARSLPNPGSPTTLVDSGITLTPSDYCGAAQGCAQTSVVSGVPTGVTLNVTNAPLVQIGLPLQGGSAEQALCDGNAACGGTAYYRSNGAAMTAGPTGSYIGAVGPPPVAGKLPLSVIW